MLKLVRQPMRFQVLKEMEVWAHLPNTETEANILLGGVAHGNDGGGSS